MNCATTSRPPVGALAYIHLRRSASGSPAISRSIRKVFPAPEGPQISWLCRSCRANRKRRISPSRPINTPFDNPSDAPFPAMSVFPGIAGHPAEPSGLRPRAVLMHVLDDLDLGYRHHALVHHGVEKWKQRLNLVGRIDHRNHERSIVGKRHAVGAANQGARSVTFDSAKDRGAGNIQLAAFFDNGPVQRLAFPLIVFAEMNAQHLGLSFEPHGRSSFLRSPSWY